MILAAGPLLAAPKSDVTVAATALGNALNYSWQTVENWGTNAQWQPGPMDGKTEKNGYTVVTMSMMDNTSGFVRKGTNAAVHTTDNGWQTMAEASHVYTGLRGPGMAVSQALELQLPAVETTNLIAWASDLKVEGDKITCTLTEDGAKWILGDREPRGGWKPIPPGIGGSIVQLSASNAKGTLTFWVSDGKLTKYQTHVTGSLSSSGGPNRLDQDLTKTVTIKDVGSTKVEVPDDAKKKMQ